MCNNVIETLKHFFYVYKSTSGRRNFCFEFYEWYFFRIWRKTYNITFIQSKMFSSWWHTVKLARAKLPANAGNFTCSSQVKRSLAQFTCVTCSLPVITGKFTCFEVASTSRRTHAHCLRAHVNLPEYHRYFTGSFTCGTHANLPATSMQNCLLLQAKIHATYRQEHWNRS